MTEQPRRLDSWKEIAEYLGRDVRTAMRWAKSQQLPVRRVGGNGRSVFAFTHEVDAWLAGSQGAASTQLESARDRSSLPPPGPAPLVPAGPRIFSVRSWRFVAACAGLSLVLAGASLQWRARRADIDSRARISVTELGVTLSDGDGKARELLRFASDLTPVLTPLPPAFHDADADGTRQILVGVAFYVDHRNRAPHNGELINVSGDGTVQWRFTFDDVLTFGQGRFDGPWGLTDWSVRPSSSPARIAVAAHHHTWWPSMAAILDHQGRRLTTFVHPGWIESLMWLDEGRVAAAGFANARDAAMLAVIDADAADTRAPGIDDARFACVSCGEGTPAFYATFGRSELNVVSGGRFNRARVSRENGRIVVRTLEIDGDPISVTGIYEFDSALRLVRAQYDDLYWTVHARLEREGKIRHPRDMCPDRDGPGGIDVWTRGRWQHVLAPR